MTSIIQNDFAGLTNMTRVDPSQINCLLSVFTEHTATRSLFWRRVYDADAQCRGVHLWMNEWMNLTHSAHCWSGRRGALSSAYQLSAPMEAVRRRCHSNTLRYVHYLRRRVAGRSKRTLMTLMLMLLESHQCDVRDGLVISSFRKFASINTTRIPRCFAGASSSAFQTCSSADEPWPDAWVSRLTSAKRIHMSPLTGFSDHSARRNQRWANGVDFLSN